MTGKLGISINSVEKYNMSDYIPPFEKRSTEELLGIIGNEEEWEKAAVELTYTELKERNVPSEEFIKAKENYKNIQLQEKNKKAKESYSVIEFILEPATILAVILQWELKKDGYLRKARQLNRIRIVVAVLTFLIIFFNTLK